MKYGVVERGDGLRTSCSIFWRVRQSAGVRDGRGESWRIDGELMVSSCRDGELMLSLLPWVCGLASCEMGCSGVDCIDVADVGVCGGVSSSGGGAIVDKQSECS
jgi:hypothetical protein